MSQQSEGATVRITLLLTVGIALLLLSAGISCSAQNDPGLAPAQAVSVPPPPRITATLSPGMATVVSKWATSDAARTPTRRLRASATPSSTREPTPTEFSFPILRDPDADPTLWANSATASAICQFWSDGYESSPDGSWNEVTCELIGEGLPSDHLLKIVPAGSLVPFITFESMQFGSRFAYPYVFRWSRDGRTAYISAGQALYRLDLADGTTTVIVPPSSYPWFEMELSPDENTLAMAYPDYITGAPLLELRDLSTDSTAVLRLDSSFQTVGNTLIWTPGSDRLALYLRSETLNSDEELVGGRSRLLVVDMDPPRITASLPEFDRLIWIEAWESRNILRIGSWLPQQDESEDEIQLIDLNKQVIQWRATVTPPSY